MKKGCLFLFSLFTCHTAIAESDVDQTLKSIGLVDENYVYIDDEALVTEFFRYTTNQYAQSLPTNLNSFIQMYSAMMTPYLGNFEAIYTIPFNDEDKAAIAQELSSKEVLQNACIDYYIPHEFMLANNYTLIYSYSDQNFRPIAKVTMTLESCYEALSQ